MTFKRLSEYFQQLESTTLRNKMTEILAELFKEAEEDEIGKLCYLLQGRVAPLYKAIEFGVADKMMIKAVAQGLDIDAKQVERTFKKAGDLGSATANLKSQISNLAPSPKRLWRVGDKTKSQNLKLSEVYDVLYKLATAGGEGSQEEKIKLLGDLLAQVDPLSARYIVRITLAKLRLGFSDMTVLDSLSWMLKGSKELRPDIERAYNVRPDLGFISETIKKKGIEGLKHIEPKVGTPILMARAERLTTPEEIIEKIGECAIEGKYDGFRVQVHYKKIKNQKSKIKNNRKGYKDTSDGGRPSLRGHDSSKVEGSVKLFSRNLEDVTHMYPDIVEGVREEVRVKEAIFEGEAIAYDPKTGRYLPFQETVQRKRKYNIEAMAKKAPLKLIAFDLLYFDGENLINRPYRERRKKLEGIISSTA